MRDVDRASFNIAPALNDHRGAENRTGRAQRGPRPACVRDAKPAILKAPSFKTAIAR
jgi:hypothetical protein